uniref:Uncharacterized protein n=1 Tax=Romanomermis culicivorax TaxID=13658 RepID=A0A915KZZ1_ROMCU
MSTFNPQSKAYRDVDAVNSAALTLNISMLIRHVEKIKKVADIDLRPSSISLHNPTDTLHILYLRINHSYIPFSPAGPGSPSLPGVPACPGMPQAPESPGSPGGPGRSLASGVGPLSPTGPGAPGPPSSPGGPADP